MFTDMKLEILELLGPIHAPKKNVWKLKSYQSHHAPMRENLIIPVNGKT
jgi:hypothetical protein